MAEESAGDRYLESARMLVQSLEAGDEMAADKAIDELTHIRETVLFKELGMLTRELHESIKAFRLDTRLSDIAESEIPDARDRLNYVITMTEQAAHRTLTAIEDSINRVDVVIGKAQPMRENWQRFRNREMAVDEFRVLCRDLDEFLEASAEEGGKVQSNLTEALMAQDYQDLTGQIIRRVINLVQEVEENLVQLVRFSGGRILEENAASADKNKDGAIKAEGPSVPGVDKGDVVQGQDDVDDLLSSLGF
ncbi:chemotaxis protein CheZ [Alkalilimnicola ehrlichii]|uniref:Protein phosphatase CheZ n=1 Tax=Alkalilimnicola ehrlichii TaxID=351052 RepID=A0A3E0WU64_9GAMM|nr:protein phosphatase CheZ [Alkalilimnicola ehrlichii]RFA28529.1 chemotaxis protein CheZ [Alkalilimnicola ehrlichii]RFA35691.1 chemotaxis protein CheZ [Alkalilimnicola ehrlichii]